ncbi:MAG: hypothetical protein IJJ26_02630 [Victivallales bacterium]|nr:hypothetical protein [Victivallales bacterium]
MEWAAWLLQRHGFYQAWLDGATICDPTAGEGAFASALVQLARRDGHRVTQAMLRRITLVELDPTALAHFSATFRSQERLVFPPENLLCQDIILSPPARSFDLLAGNPPWTNFTDLPADYKERLKPHFLAEGVVSKGKRLLLGFSRVDIAALVLQVVLGRLLNRRGRAAFFLPTSLFCNTAHAGFRNFTSAGRVYRPLEVVECLRPEEVFSGVQVSCCSVCFEMDMPVQYPVRWLQRDSTQEVACTAEPSGDSNGPWRICNGSNALAQPQIVLRPDQHPRQGINTCGANEVFLFDSYPDFLPPQFLYPLATPELWHGKRTPRRWLLAPYHPASGRPLSWSEIEAFPSLAEYLLQHKALLEQRRSAILQHPLRKGVWWILFGIGPYAFTPYKVIWEAYGRCDFRPIILSQSHGRLWQANQAMHAYIPCQTLAEAKALKRRLDSPAIQDALRQLHGAGTRSWAQPGRIYQILMS